MGSNINSQNGKKLGEIQTVAMELTGLDIAIRRMQSIEQQFQSLSSLAAPELDGDFQSILNSQMADKTSEVDDVQDKIFSPISAAGSKKLSNTELDSIIDRYSSQNGLDSDFVKALIKQESGFRSTAKSHCGAMGLMQLMPATASSLGVHNAFDPEQNVAGGTKYLKGLLDRFDGNKELALAAYNAGPGAVKKYGGIPPYSETKNYVKNVMSNYINYKTGGAE